jgi:flagellar biogenesis protein FliO
VPQDPTMSLKDLADIVKSVVTIVGILIGGAWSYMRFVRGRILKPHVNVRVSGSVRSVGDRHFVVVRVSVVNKGNVVVHVDHRETSVAVFAERRSRGRIAWADIDALVVLEETNLVEPDEDVEAEYLVPLPCAPKVPLRVIFHVKARARFFGIGRVSRWETSHVIVPKEKADVSNETTEVNVDGAFDGD